MDAKTKKWTMDEEEEEEEEKHENKLDLLINLKRTENK